MLVVSLYEDEGQDRFKVFLVEGDDEGTEVTDQYEVFAVQMEDGRPAWAVAQKEA